MRELERDGARVALAFRAHSGWAALVALRDPIAAPLVVQRRRVDLLDQATPRQPYHEAAKMPLPSAETFLQECAAVVESLAKKAVEAVLTELVARRYTIAGSSILMGSGRTPATLQATLASHAMIHTAEGDFYRNALRLACDSCGLGVVPTREKQLWEQAAAGLRRSRADLESRLCEFGRNLGPPWREDQKLCAVAAWIVLASPDRAPTSAAKR